jgi:DNA repair protein SbcD/Mre11
MFKFIHAADLHLDSKLRNLEAYDGAPTKLLKTATRQAFAALVQTAITEDVAFVLLAGDLYDHECESFNTPLFFRKQMEELARHEIKVFLVQGNHDSAEQSMARAYALDLPENVHLFDVRKATSVLIEELQVVIHGQGYATRKLLDNLAQGFPPRKHGWCNIGLLHCNLNESSGHGNYAPCSVSDLVQKNYSYWALGHIHKRSVRQERSTWIVYPGNLQGRHVRETGTKGCSLVTVEDGEVQSVDHVPLEVVRWEHLELSAETLGAESPGDLVDRIVDEVKDLLQAAAKPIVVRITVSGSTPLHGALVLGSGKWVRALREGVVNRCGDQACLEKVIFNTQPPQLTEALDQDSEAALTSLLAHLDSDLLGAALKAVEAKISEPLAFLEPAQDDDPLESQVSFDTAEQREELLRDVDTFLRAALQQPELYQD